MGSSSRPLGLEEEEEGRGLREGGADSRNPRDRPVPPCSFPPERLTRCIHHKPEGKLSEGRNTHMGSDGSPMTAWALARGINPADRSDSVMVCAQALWTRAPGVGVCRGRDQSPLRLQTPLGPSGQSSGCRVQPSCRLCGPLTSGTNLSLWRFPLCFSSNSLSKY